MDILEQFSDRVIHDWLPKYCGDAARNYPLEGFRLSSIGVDVEDARCCMLAIDSGVVIDTGGGRYLAAKSFAVEVLFWEGQKAKHPRPITLWHEPVITMAALARLHLEYGWPKELLGMQSKGWAFDLAAYGPASSDHPRILAEVKKSNAEMRRLARDLFALSTLPAFESHDSCGVLENSVKKWRGLLSARPNILWLIGPARAGMVYHVSYPSPGHVKLLLTEPEVLEYPKPGA